MKSNSQDFYTNYPDLSNRNDGLADMLIQQKTMLNCAAPLMLYKDDGDYGFISELPHDTYTSNTISDCNLEWMTTGDFSGKLDNNGKIIDNHCGSVAAANLALYFGTQGYSKLLKANNFETFKAIHSYIGNGPAMTIADKARDYFRDCGYTLNYETSLLPSNLSIVITAIDNDRSCGFLLENSLLSWHWVLAVGYRTGNVSGKTYFTIVNGWQKSAHCFYRVNEGSTWMSSSEYWMG